MKKEKKENLFEGFKFVKYPDKITKRAICQEKNKEEIPQLPVGQNNTLLSRG